MRRLRPARKLKPRTRGWATSHETTKLGEGPATEKTAGAKMVAHLCCATVWRAGASASRGLCLALDTRAGLGSLLVVDALGVGGAAPGGPFRDEVAICGRSKSERKRAFSAWIWRRLCASTLRSSKADVGDPILQSSATPLNADTIRD